jgi:hypothetical protein
MGQLFVCLEHRTWKEVKENNIRVLGEICSKFVYSAINIAQNARRKLLL